MSKIFCYTNPCGFRNYSELGGHWGWNELTKYYPVLFRERGLGKALGMVIWMTNGSKNVSVDDGSGIWNGCHIVLTTVVGQEDPAICDVVVDPEEGIHRKANHTK